MFDKLRQAQLHAHDWQQESLTFVPLRGSWFAQSEHSFDLEEEMTKFLLSDKKVLLLLGDSGSGKSLYTQGLASKLWQDHKPDFPIPVWISLPSLRNPINRAIEETFEKFGFTIEQIESLKQKNSFIFILDAFDEIHQLKNLWVSNHCDQWKAKIIITCRREYLYHVDNYKLYFTPFNGEKAVYQEYDEMIIKPFSEEQIEQYIKQYIQHQKPEWELERYQKASEEMPGLKNLIKTPFLLKLAMEALPKMPQDKEQKTMTQAKLYDVFIEQWFIRQEQKLKLAKKIKEDENIKPEFWDYAKKLAQLMHQQKITQVTYDSSQSSDLFGEAEDNPWQKFFNADAPRIELLRTACLVREAGQNQYAFVHDSLLEYFLTRDLYEYLLSKQEEVAIIQEASKAPRLKDKKQENYFNQRLFVKETNAIQFLADRISEDKLFKKSLFNQIYTSKNNPQGKISAANAITILNKASVSFSGLDLSDIQIPQADLSNSLLFKTNLTKSDLSGVDFTDSYLSDANLTDCQMKDINLGRLPFLQLDEIPLCIAYSHYHSYMAVGLKGKFFIYEEKNKNYQKIAEFVMNHADDFVYSLAFSPDGKTLATGCNTIVGLWDMTNLKNIIELKGHTDQVSAIAFSANGKILASGSSDKTIRLWSMLSQKEMVELKGHAEGVKSVAFTPDGKALASGGNNNAVCLWDLMNHQLLSTLKGHNSTVNAVAFSPDGKTLVSSSNDYTVRLWDTLRYIQIAELKEHAGSVQTIAFSPDGKTLASGSFDNRVCLWEINTQLLLAEMYTATSIWSIAFSLDGKTLAVGTSNSTIQFWNLINQKPPNQIRGHKAKILSVAFSPDGKIFASRSYDRTVYFWDRSTLSPLSTLKVDSPVNSIVFSLDSNFLFLASGDKNLPIDHSSIQVWDIKNQKFLQEIKTHTKNVSSITYSPDEKVIASLSEDEIIRLWDIQSQNLLAELKGHNDVVNSIAFSPDGKTLASGGEDKIVFLWDVSSRKKIAELKGHEKYIFCIAFWPQGRFFASGSSNIYEGVKLWDIENQKLLYNMNWHHDGANTIAFSPDGKLFASGSANSIAISDVFTQQLIAVIKMPTHVYSIAFSPNGRFIVAGSDDHSVKLWKIQKNINEIQVTLYWTTHHAFFAAFANLKGVKGLSAVNAKFFSQMEAKNVPELKNLLEEKEILPIKIIDKDLQITPELKVVSEAVIPLKPFNSLLSAQDPIIEKDESVSSSGDSKKPPEKDKEIILNTLHQDNKLDKIDQSISSNSQTFFQSPRNNNQKEEKIASRKCCTII
jgi:WD40 repeat protein